MKIEAGKFYRLRNGRKIGPVSALDPYTGEFGWSANGRKWQENGVWGAVPDFDIIEEWIDEPTLADAAVWSDPYAPLKAVLEVAFMQAAEGKGNKRHANGKPFLEQPILEIARMVGPGFHAGQVMKKAQEAMGMINRGETDAAKSELHGIIIYAAASILLIDEIAGAKV